MKTRKIAILTVVLLICFSCFIITSCSQNNENNHEHSFTQSILPPTCEEPSYLVSKCICGVEESRSIFDDPLGHKFGEYVYDNNATCEEDGTQTATCTRDNCGKIDVKVKSNTALGHDLNNDGKCSRCDYELEQIPDHEHSFTQSILPPTCEEPSYLVSKCICGVEESRSIFDDPLGHKFGEYVYDNNATCEEDGTETATCTRDNCNKTDVKVKENTAGHVVDSNGDCLNCDYKKESIGLSFYKNSWENFYIVEGIGTCTDKTIVIPEYYNGLLVKEIDFLAFENVTQIKSIYLPNSIETIYDGAFSGCVNLSKVVINEDSNLKRIYNNAFENCVNLTTITVPQNITTISNDAFYGCVRLVEAYNLSSLNVETNLLSYEKNGYHFLNVYKNKKDSKLSKNGDYILYTSGDETFLINYVGNATEIAIPNYVTQIHIGAFINNKTLKKVNIPSSVRIINGGAFAYSNISEITIPKTVESLGWSAFRSSNIEKVTFEDNGKLVGISDYTFYDCQNLKYIKLGNSIKNIGEYAFAKCQSLNKLDGNISQEFSISYKSIMESGLLTSSEYKNAYYLGLGNNPYYLLLKAKSINIESCEINSNCKVISDEAFYGCNKLKEITIPSSVIEIGDRAFHYCSSLTKVIIPNSVEKIGSFAFTYCHSLDTLYCESSSKKQGWETGWDRKSYYGGNGNKFTIIWNYNS